MIEQQGRIVSLTGRRAMIAIGASSGCPACDAGKGCGAGIFGLMMMRKPLLLELDNPLQLKAGEGVMVGIPEAFFLGLLARLYLLPLMAGMIGAALGHSLADGLHLQSAYQDLLALLGALFLAFMTLLKNARGKHWQKAELQLTLLTYLPDQPGQNCRARLIKDALD